jgi:hypothetical protein
METVLTIHIQIQTVSMDIKILTAVLASLAVLIGLSGGNVDDLEFDRENLLPENLLGYLDPPEFLQGDSVSSEPAEISLQVTENTSLGVESGSLILGDGEITSGSGTIQSEKEVTFRNFRGDLSLKPGGVEVDGSASGFRSGSLNISSETDLNHLTAEARVKGMKGFDGAFRRANLVLRSNGSTFESSNSTVRIESFSGKISMFENGTVEMDGNITSLEAGELSWP